MGGTMTFTQQSKTITKQLGEIDNENLGPMAAIIEFWFQEHNIDLVLLPPITEKPKQAEKKTIPVKKRKDKQIPMF